MLKNQGLNLYNLNRNQTLLLKFFAIVLIVEHNFIKYFIPNGPLGENEFTFNSNNVWNFIQGLLLHPEYCVDYFFSYCGHYGVQIFIFISGFGLCKLFVTKGVPNYLYFLLRNYLKIYLLLIFGLVVCLSFSSLYEPVNKLASILYYLSLKNKFIPEGGPGGVLNMGSWWYFGLVIQLYTIFPILYFIINKFKERGFYVLLIIYLIISYSILYNFISFGFNTQDTILAHLPEVCFGILVARKEIKISPFIFLLGLVVFLLSNFYEFLFPLSFISVLIVLLFLLNPFILSLKNQNNKFYIYIGKISMILFVLNSFIRFLFYDYLSVKPFINLIIYSIGLLLICSVAYYIYKYTFLKFEAFLFKFIPYSRKKGTKN